jgi:hypothetical protein
MAETIEAVGTVNAQENEQVNNNEQPQGQENQENPTVDLQKIVGEEVLAAVSAAADTIRGESFSTVEDAMKSAGQEDDFFNPTLSQYKEGLIINTDRRLVKIKRAIIRNSSRKAWVIVAPAGYRRGNEIVYSQAFNFYPSTLRKSITRTNDVGEPVLDKNNNPISSDSKASQNPVWKGAHACANAEELLNYALDKHFEVIELYRDFGPSLFTTQPDGSMVPRGHKLTTLPLFNAC